MFSREVLEKLFSDEEIQGYTIGIQSNCIHEVDRVLEQIAREKPDVKLSELFTRHNATTEL